MGPCGNPRSQALCLPRLEHKGPHPSGCGGSSSLGTCATVRDGVTLEGCNNEGDFQLAALMTAEVAGRGAGRPLGGVKTQRRTGPQTGLLPAQRPYPAPSHRVPSYGGPGAQ